MDEPMEVDEEPYFDDEEGELTDSKVVSGRSSPKLVTSESTADSLWRKQYGGFFSDGNMFGVKEQSKQEKRYENKGGGFFTGVNIFGEKEQSKLGERAVRFGLNPSEAKSVSEEQLKYLYKSLGVKNGDGVDEKGYRLNTLHMRGTENMSTQDIFNYFKDYGPASIEWINDYACNVVWLDDISAARAILSLSSEIRGLKLPKSRKKLSRKAPYSDEDGQEGIDDDDNDDEDREVDLIVVDQIRSEDGEIIMIVDEIHEKNSEDPKKVDATEITIPVPPGLWRKGVDFPKAKCILLRFATYLDKKLPRAERLSDYYKRYGNPNYGGIRGLITASRKRRYYRNVPNQVFDDDVGDERDFKNAPETEDNKNPWGSLAKSWSNIDKNREKQRTDRYYGDSPPRKMTPPPSPLLDSGRNTSILRRLGNSGPPPIRSSHFRSENFHSEEEEEQSAVQEEDRDWSRRSKVPRMRMYADEEQRRLERRKIAERSNRKRRFEDDHRDSRSDDSSKEVRRSDARSRGSRSRSDSKHVSRSRVRSREDLRRRLVTERRRYGGNGRNSSSSSTVSTKRSNIARKSRTREDFSDLDFQTYSPNEDSEDDDSDLEYGDLRETLGKKRGSRFDGEDLRSKINFKKTLKQGSFTTKSPLRIEIDNDEYYKLIGNG